MRCAIIGAGAIGKAVAGYAFCGVGGEVAFVDSFAPVIEDMNRRGGYRIWQGGARAQEVSGVTACLAGTPQADLALKRADCVVTAVGPGAFAAVAKSLAAAFAKRTAPLSIFLFENDAGCEARLANAFGGALPPALRAYKASIERMSRGWEKDGAFDVCSEPYLPVILERGALADNPFLADERFFALVDDVSRYYARKLFTNNLGHAVLGFWGLRAGCTTLAEAANEPRTYARAREALAESAAMMAREYGFAAEEMRSHVADLLDRRYRVPGMDDPLERLVRDPKRKLGYDERLVGAARRCLKNGIAPKAIVETIALALEPEIKSSGSAEAALRTVCALSPGEPLWQALLDTIQG